MRELAWLALVVLPAGGCVSTGAVARYARASGETAAAFPVLAEGMTASCMRLERYRESREGEAWFDDADLAGRCAPRERAVKRAVAVDRVLASYFAALGALADDGVVKYSTAVDGLADALAEDARLDAKRVRAVSDLAAFAASASTDGYRHLELTRVIEEQNANVIAVIEALGEIVGSDYANILDLEAAGMDAYYRAALVEGAEREPLAAVLVRDRRAERAEALHARRAAVDAFVKALGTMKKGHQRLFDSRRDLNAKKVAAELSGYAAEMEKLLVALDEAFRTDP